MNAQQPGASSHTVVWLIAAVVVAGLAAGGIYWMNRSSDSSDGKGSEIRPPVDPPRGSNGSTPDGPPWFRDMTADSGMHFNYRNGEEENQFTILESVGGGVALLDYDGDGLLDIFVTGGGTFGGPEKKQLKGLPCKLYKNIGGWKFKDVTKDAGLDVTWWYTHGVAVADYDRDGWTDLLVTGYGKLALFHNESDGKGGRRFVDVTEKLGLRDDSWSAGAGWGDLDGDGFPDLYVCHYADWSFTNNPACVAQRPGVPRDVCPPQRFRPLMHALFRNEKGQRFVNVSAEHGFKADGYGMGVVLVDVNDDRQPDIHVANDASNNLLFLNRKGKLEEKGVWAGVALDDSGNYQGSMGVDAGDYDGSGRPALLVTNFQRQPPGLFRNLGDGLFQYQSTATGLAGLDRTYVGWGTGFIDVDNDGWEDLVIVNGHPFRYPAGATMKQRPQLLHNEKQADQRIFKDVSAQGGDFFKTPASGRGVAIGDLDNDGWPDLVISNTNDPVVLLRNEMASIHKHRWLGVKLVGKGNRDVVGSTVILEGSTRKLTRFAKGGGSYLSANDQRLLFGLGELEQVQRVTVKWSWGETQTWENLAANRYHELREGP